LQLIMLKAMTGWSELAAHPFDCYVRYWQS
jgi:hypothetical protein